MTAQLLAFPRQGSQRLPVQVAPAAAPGLAPLEWAPGELIRAMQPLFELVRDRTAAVEVGYVPLGGGWEGGPCADLVAALGSAEGPLAFGDTRRSPQTAGLFAVGTLALLAAPVRNAAGRLVGALLARGAAPQVWSPRDRQLLGTVGGLLTLLATRLEPGARQRRAHEEALRALGLLLEARDAETRGHTDRVTALALRLGRELGLNAAELRDLRWGAYLHDIGKISLPDAVLRHPGLLDAAGRARMQEHVAEGTRLAGQLPFLSPAALDVIAAHHEHWDGGGYPRGLAGEAIPLHARIFAACDVYDALTSVRPYKRAWTHAEAAAYLRQHSGSQFDPAVVAALLRVLEPEAAQLESA